MHTHLFRTQKRDDEPQNYRKDASMKVNKKGDGSSSSGPTVPSGLDVGRGNYDGW